MPRPEQAIVVRADSPSDLDPERIQRRKFTLLVAVVGFDFILDRSIDVVSFMADIKTLSIPTPPQRQAVELSGGTHHRVDAGSVKFSFHTPQATVTHVRAKAPAASWV